MRSTHRKEIGIFFFWVKHSRTEFHDAKRRAYHCKKPPIPFALHGEWEASIGFGPFQTLSKR